MTTRPLFISTFCCIDHPLDTALDTLASRTSHVEILSDGLHDLLADSTPCSEYPFSYSVHAPTAAMSTSRRSTNACGALRSRCSGDVLAASARIGAEHLVVHPGYSPYEQVRDRSYASLLRSLDDLARLQEEHGVRVCVENMGAWECCHFRTPAFLPELTARGLGFTLDCGHARLNGNLDEFLAAGGFCHVHLHDKWGQSTTIRVLRRRDDRFFRHDTEDPRSRQPLSWRRGNLLRPTRARPSFTLMNGECK